MIYEIRKKKFLKPTIPGKAATFAIICLTPGRNPPTPYGQINIRAI